MNGRQVLLPAVALLLVGAALALDGAVLWREAMAWLQHRQAGLHRELAMALRAVRDGGIPAAGGLIAVSFLYGAVHAAGPGHGKAVIAAYVLADGRRLRHGLALVWASALMQAVTAIALVIVVVYGLGMASRDARPVALALEQLGYGLVAIIGAAMLWTAARRTFARAGSGRHGGRRHDYGHAEEHGGCGHSGRAHGVCGHAHASLPLDAATWRRSAAVVASVGLRPCSGALVVLAFAQTFGILAAGIAATLAMAVGTALTVSALAVLAVGSRHLTLSLAAGGKWAERVEIGLVGAGGTLLLLLGGLLLAGSFRPVEAPFG